MVSWWWDLHTNEKCIISLFPLFHLILFEIKGLLSNLTPALQFSHSSEWQKQNNFLLFNPLSKKVVFIRAKRAYRAIFLVPICELKWRNISLYLEKCTYVLKVNKYHKLVFNLIKTHRSIIYYLYFGPVFKIINEIIVNKLWKVDKAVIFLTFL